MRVFTVDDQQSGMFYTRLIVFTYPTKKSHI